MNKFALAAYPESRFLKVASLGKSGDPETLDDPWTSSPKPMPHVSLLVKQVENLATVKATTASYRVFFFKGTLAGAYWSSRRSTPTEGKPHSNSVAFPLFIKNRPKHFIYHTKVSFAGGSHWKDWSRSADDPPPPRDWVPGSSG